MFRKTYLLITILLSWCFFLSCDGKSVPVRFESKGKDEHYLLVSDTHGQTMGEISVVDLEIANQKGKLSSDGLVWSVVFLSSDVPMKEVIRYGEDLGGKVLVPAKPLIKGHKYYFIIFANSAQYSFEGNFVYGEPSK
ncbi:hypothetical protein EHQ12_02405 [Leptospira gomenensis]|uniref:Lipoprotein n=1 Tax=Leptospira gomenensis TaxID=2484974 RepID=A0A5F1YIF1_9LEPT|nr:hypothetical protein [Leptospira gomenensis]TGK32506.1 hypothetical protein EHQ17_12540 [Leptospira gomenensis]TGK42526.1 hypothetical protein EHQ07_14740 [Leptospira gomenensis]TGK44055.1 hypothetical protein EHQ12_02405 [Leptospira gomenensis]TGK55735.1 hypothetical protein EHQ13_16810 [Leptospira gomenensis]